MTPFLVGAFDKLTISNLIKECFGSEFQDLNRKDQVNYIYRYLADLNAETVLLETEYVDKDYLDDYSKFYVRRFSSRGSRCARLHFFKGKRKHFQFEEYLGKGGPVEDLKKLQQDYLGFVVVKPLPKTVIGKTCLKTYDRMASPKVALRRTYRVSLFGIELSVDSVAFQEQDKVTSACAATSIWCALHALRWRDPRDIPSCSEITTNAINFIPGSSNSFPSRELTNKQILRALDVQRLRHHTHSLHETPQAEALELIRCYIGSGLPLILGVEVYSIKADRSLERLDGHALTIVGFDPSPGHPALYVHDDRLGPYARADLVPINDAAAWTQRWPLPSVVTRPFSKPSDGFRVDGSRQSWGLVLRKKSDDGVWQEPHELLVPENFVAMADKKVALSVDLVLNTCDLIKQAYDGGLADLALEKQVDPDQFSLTFAVKLMDISSIKEEILRGSNCAAQTSTSALSDAESRRTIFLTTAFARFQWVARFDLGGKSAFLMLVDATDIPQGHAVSAIYIQDLDLYNVIMEAIGNIRDDQLFGIEQKSMFSSFLRRARPEVHTLKQHLDEHFGEPRAPMLLKAEEVRNDDVVENKDRRPYYESTSKSLDDLYPEFETDPNAYRIWVINHEGTLIIGKEIDKTGHPTLTGFKPARIGGELRKDSNGWFINSKSGRYSGNYRNVDKLLEHALERFRSVFHRSRDQLRVQPWVPDAPSASAAGTDLPADKSPAHGGAGNGA